MLPVARRRWSRIQACSLMKLCTAGQQHAQQSATASNSSRTQGPPPYCTPHSHGHCRRASAKGGCSAPLTSRAGMLRSSTKMTHLVPKGGPNTPLRRLSRRASTRSWAWRGQDSSGQGVRGRVRWLPRSCRHVVAAPLAVAHLVAAGLRGEGCADAAKGALALQSIQCRLDVDRLACGKARVHSPF
jgi:hypothetical protein